MFTSGQLTEENIEFVVSLLRRLLSGRTFTSSNLSNTPEFGMNLHVSPSRYLTMPDEIHPDVTHPIHIVRRRKSPPAIRIYAFPVAGYNEFELGTMFEFGHEFVRISHPFEGGTISHEFHVEHPERIEAAADQMRIADEAKRIT